MSHEKTFDFESGGRHFLAPTVIGGQPVDPRQVIEMIMSGQMRPLAQASTPQGIKTMAEQRSPSHSSSPTTNPMNELIQSLLGMFGGGQPSPMGLFATDPMMQQLMDIERQTGDQQFVGDLDSRLREQGRGVEVTRQKRGVQRLAPTQFGETTGRFGLPPGISGGPKRAGVYPEAHGGFAGVERQTLQGRNPFVQALLDTMMHELGHVGEQITPGAGWRSPESVAGTFGGEGLPKDPRERQRYQQVKQFISPDLQKAAEALGVRLE